MANRCTRCRCDKGERVPLVDHVFNSIVPDHVDVQTLFKEGPHRLETIPALWLSAVHLHPDHPSHWNVVFANVSSRMVLIYREGGWCYIPFRVWARSFTEDVFRIYCREMAGSVDMGEFYRVCFDERVKDVEQSLEVTLLGPMRTKVKVYHKLR